MKVQPVSAAATLMIACLISQGAIAAPMRLLCTARDGSSPLVVVMDAEARTMNGLPALFSDTQIRWVAQLRDAKGRVETYDLSISRLNGAYTQMGRGAWAYPVTLFCEKAPVPKF